MRTQEALLERRSDIQDSLEDDDLPPQIRQSLQAQKEILTWVIEGDVLPDEYLVEGRLKMSGEVFEKVIIAGVDQSGRVFPSGSCEDEGEYILAKRPSREQIAERRYNK